MKYRNAILLATSLLAVNAGCMNFGSNKTTEPNISISWFKIEKSNIEKCIVSEIEFSIKCAEKINKRDKYGVVKFEKIRQAYFSDFGSIYCDDDILCWIPHKSFLLQQGMSYRWHEGEIGLITFENRICCIVTNLFQRETIRNNMMIFDILNGSSDFLSEKERREVEEFVRSEGE